MATFDPKSYWEDRLAGAFNEKGVGYAALGRGYNYWLYRLRQKTFRRIVTKHIHPDPTLRVLDTGCGTGFYIRQWQALGIRHCTGIDITEQAVHRLREAFPDYRFITADISDPADALATGSFDIVSAFDVLFHIVDDKRYARALGHIGRVLKPGGLFFFSDNFLHGAPIRSQHQVCHTIDTITAMLTDAGLTPVARQPQFYLMNKPLDSSQALLLMYWKNIERLLCRAPALGWILGSLTYPLESALVLANRTEGPSTEIMICRKDPA